jgi:hypothetical protein
VTAAALVDRKTPFKGVLEHFEKLVMARERLVVATLRVMDVAVLRVVFVGVLRVVVVAVLRVMDVAVLRVVFVGVSLETIVTILRVMTVTVMRVMVANVQKLGHRVHFFGVFHVGIAHVYSPVHKEFRLSVDESSSVLHHGGTEPIHFNMSSQAQGEEEREELTRVVHRWREVGGMW